MKTAYITQRGPRQWGIMTYDPRRSIWIEPLTWYRTRAQVREIFRETLLDQVAPEVEPAFRCRDWGTTTLAPGLDVRGDRGQFVVAPSRHASGGVYRWEVAHHPDDVPVADAPPWLLAMLQASANVPGPGPAPPVGARIPDGERNGTLASLAGSMRRRGMGVEAIAAALVVTNAERCDPPLPEAEVREIAASVARYAPAPPPSGAAPDLAPTWPTPRPIPTARPPVTPFDVAALMPEPFSPWIHDVAERIQCPPDYVAITVMSVAGSVIGRQVVVRPKRYDDWEVVPNLWGLAIGPPGIMKTPAIKEGLRPLRHLIAAEMARYQDAMRDAPFIRMRREAREKRFKRLLEAALEAADGDGQAPDVLAIRAQMRESDEALPRERRYLTNDATVEKVGVLLNENPNGFLVFRDELAGLIRTMDREGHQNDRAFYEECWNGTGSYRVDRIERGTLYIEAACLSLLGGIQPAPLESYLREWERRGLDDGFIQRFQLMVYPDVGPFRRADRYPAPSTRDTAVQAFRFLAQLDLRRLQAQTDGNHLPWLNFEDTAQGLFDDWYAQLQTRLRSEAWPAVLRQHFAKYPSLVPALALVDHLAAGGTGPIPAVAVVRALRWVPYLASHAQRVYATLTDRVRGTTAALAQRLVSAAVPFPDPFTLRWVYRHHWTGLAERADVEPAVQRLVDLGWLREVTVPAPGRQPVLAFAINPTVRAEGFGTFGTESEWLFPENAVSATGATANHTMSSGIHGTWSQNPEGVLQPSATGATAPITADACPQAALPFTGPAGDISDPHAEGCDCPACLPPDPESPPAAPPDRERFRL